MTTGAHAPKKGYRTIRLPLAESEYGPPGANTGKFTVSSNGCVINMLER